MDAIDEIQEASININKFKNNSSVKKDESNLDIESFYDPANESVLQLSNSQLLQIEPAERT